MRVVSAMQHTLRRIYKAGRTGIKTSSLTLYTPKTQNVLILKYMYCTCSLVPSLALCRTVFSTQCEKSCRVEPGNEVKVHVHVIHWH